MTKQANTPFLEEWLRGNSGSNSIISKNHSSSSSAQAIVQAWAELRDSLQHQSFQLRHLQSLRILLDSKALLHVADPQAKILLSLLSSQNLSLPHEAYPLFFRLLYIWVRKSLRPSSGLIDLAVEFLSKFLATGFSSKKSPELFSESILLLGALSFVPSSSETSKMACLDLLCRLLEEEYRLANSYDSLIPDLLAGIGYALCSSVNVHYVRTLDALLLLWGKEDGPRGKVSSGLMILHLVEWVISGFLKQQSQEKLQCFTEEALETSKENYVPFALVMAAAGALRALNRSMPSGQGVHIVSRMRVSAENCLDSVARDLILKSDHFANSGNDCTTSLLLRCVSLALARGGSVSSRVSLLVCLASALLMEIFPLRHLYSRITNGSSAEIGHSEVKEHLNGVLFKEAGAISGVFCNQYVSVDEKNKAMVENMIWNFCHDLYSGHREVALLLRGREDELLGDIEKVAKSAFLMVVVFALNVAKHKLNSKFSYETQIETSVSILISFSCIEYFRHIRLPEYMDTIRRVAVSVQENESACIAFVQSMPSYVDLINPQGLQQRVDYKWYEDEVQTTRILFYMRVIPTCIERLTGSLFSRVLAPTMFLYLGHPNGKVARASHSMFVAFTSSGKDCIVNERSLLKEQLAFYYIKRSLEGYPGITPFEGMASGVVALVRNLPAGSSATFYCIHSLIDKANRLCNDTFTKEADMWKNWSGEPGPCKKILELLLRLISLVDIQVLPTLMKLLAQLITQLPKDGQNVVLNELYTQVAASDDVTRKPTLVSWLQSVSYLCSQPASVNASFKSNGIEEGPLNFSEVHARL